MPRCLQMIATFTGTEIVKQIRPLKIADWIASFLITASYEEEV